MVGRVVGAVVGVSTGDCDGQAFTCSWEHAYLAGPGRVRAFYCSCVSAHRKRMETNLRLRVIRSSWAAMRDVRDMTVCDVCDYNDSTKIGLCLT